MNQMIMMIKITINQILKRNINIRKRKRKKMKNQKMITINQIHINIRKRKKTINLTQKKNLKKIKNRTRIFQFLIPLLVS